eukprot:TRINITY_DN1411_c0_g2_i1.p1 TRINITY_DN1411_c0_g2~~TRINITY_DN1411_c0_g2_i1.p1  ORF type:complete len:223 (-),score=46.98 TRINITY_DN1411_c0_g2_i1:121-789(-)
MSRVCVAGGELTSLPSATDADTAASLDASYNQIDDLRGLDAYQKVKHVILDNNNISSIPDDLKTIESVELLSLNNNNISDLEKFMDGVSGKFPNLRHLSMLKNPACPNEMLGTGDKEEYARYRFYVIYRCPKLNILDLQSVTAAERVEALRRGQFCKKVTPKTEPSTFVAASPTVADDDEPPELPQSQSTAGNVGPTKFGQATYVYYGKQSEGDRFIRNDDL